MANFAGANPAGSHCGAGAAQHGKDGPRPVPALRAAFIDRTVLENAVCQGLSNKEYFIIVLPSAEPAVRTSKGATNEEVGASLSGDRLTLPLLEEPTHAIRIVALTEGT